MTFRLNNLINLKSEYYQKIDFLRFYALENKLFYTTSEKNIRTKER